MSEQIAVSPDNATLQRRAVPALQQWRTVLDPCCLAAKFPVGILQAIRQNPQYVAIQWLFACVGNIVTLYGSGL